MGRLTPKKIEDIKNNLIKAGQRRGIDIIIDDDELNDISDIVVPENSIGGEHTENSEDDDFNAQANTIEITFIEFAIVNMYLHNCFRGKHDEMSVSSYGQVDASGRLAFGGVFENSGSYWFNAKFKDNDNDFIFQTKMYVDNRNELQIQLHTSVKKAMPYNEFEKAQKKIMELAFNNSEYKGKCIKVKMKDGRFRGIEIIDIKESSNELILNDVQKKFIDHFVSRVERGGNARYLLNGEPGTGKTESIREIARRLIPKVTFIIPDFDTTDDLTSIMEACEIFESGVIIMDDIDLYLGSRDNGSYTRLLGQFLSFFDGVKKRKISLLASTNDKGLVDKAAERPGRFNFTLDYNFLDAEQIVKVCNIHLPEKWRIQEVYDALTENINGKKVNITGAFIANLAENIKEMSEDDTNWGIDDTVSLIKESYKGFYSSQVEKEKQSLGFKL
jgi:ATPase family associated with various cellular activities (AAA)